MFLFCINETLHISLKVILTRKHLIRITFLFTFPLNTSGKIERDGWRVIKYGRIERDEWRVISHRGV